MSTIEFCGISHGEILIHFHRSQLRNHGYANLPFPASKSIDPWINPVEEPREKIFMSRFGTKVEII